jgi:hypothetical protein
MYATIDEVTERVASGQPLIVAGAEPLLRALPRGNWIGGTIPYFMTPEGGQLSQQHLYVTETPAIAQAARIAVYDQTSIARIGLDSPGNGYTVIILPAFSKLLQQYAIDSPHYEQLFFKVIAGWVAGSHLDEIGQISPKVIDGRSGDLMAAQAVALHVELPSGCAAKLGIVNIFEPGDGEAIVFPTTGFEATECVIAGQRRRIDEGLGPIIVDLRLPLVANYCGTLCNVGIRDLDLANNRIRFFSPVFEGVSYRQARAVGDYAQRFLAAIPSQLHTVAFSCNCVHNYLHGQLQGRRTGSLEGPMTFGEIAYQLVNQTLVYITIEGG